MGNWIWGGVAAAVAASAALDIVLTKRGRHNGDDIPMCGGPVHAYETYLQRCAEIEVQHRQSQAVTKRLNAPTSR